MTRRTNARIAGFTFLFYIAVAFPAMILHNRATSGVGIAAQLSGMAQHATDVRVAFVLSLLGCFAALVLAVTLWAITREQDPELAMLALACRVGEGVSGAVSLPATLVLLGLATRAEAPDAASTQALGAFLLDRTPLAAMFFAVGSTLFSWLLLRGRMIPVALGWLGVIASVLAVLVLPVQAVGMVGGLIGWLMWMPMLVFEIVLALWLIIKGVALPAPRTS